MRANKTGQSPEYICSSRARRTSMRSMCRITKNYITVYRFNKINRGEIQINSAPAAYLSVSTDVALGRFIDRDLALLGHGHNISLSATVKPTSQLELDLSYSRSRLSDVSTEQLFYDGYIARFTGIYQFSSDVFFRLIGQYDEFNKAVEIDPLLSYKLNPFTICYAGSTHNLSDFIARTASSKPNGSSLSRCSISGESDSLRHRLKKPGVNIDTRLALLVEITSRPSTSAFEQNCPPGSYRNRPRRQGLRHQMKRRNILRFYRC